MARKVAPTGLFNWLARRPMLLLLGGVLIGGWYGYELFLARPAMALLGVPEAQEWKAATWTRIFRNEAYMVGYSDLRANPLWVTYRVTPLPAEVPRLKRPERFEADWRAILPIEHEDYRGSGYDRGHMAPNSAISKLYGRQAQLETFLMTNITPQRPSLNQKLWERIEEAEVDLFAPRFGEVWVVTGPLFDDKVERLKSSPRVEIPDAFFKIFAAKDERGVPRLLALIVPQGVSGKEPIEQFVTTVDEVERVSGFDFFWELADDVEARIESGRDASDWPLVEASNRRSRY